MAKLSDRQVAEPIRGLADWGRHPLHQDKHAPDRTWARTCGVGTGERSTRLFWAIRWPKGDVWSRWHGHTTTGHRDQRRHKLPV